MTDIFKLVVGSDGKRNKVQMSTEELESIASLKPDLITVDQVNDEAQRRIYAVMPQHRQANLTARAVILAAKGSINWTEAEVAEWAAGLAQWVVIDTLRGHSNDLNLMDPIPQDYADDKWWQ